VTQKYPILYLLFNYQMELFLQKKWQKRLDYYNKILNKAVLSSGSVPLTYTNVCVIFCVEGGEKWRRIWR